MKKISSLLILLSIFLMPIPKVYAAEIGGTINEVLIPTQSANKSAVLFIPVSSCVLNNNNDYCQFYVDLNGTRVSAIKVTTSTPKINDNKYYQLTFDYSRAKTKGKENIIIVTTGSTSIETVGYTSKEEELVGTCNSKANMVKAQGVILTRKVGTNKVEKFEELINIINGPDGFDVAAGTGIKFPIYVFYTYQGADYLNYFDYTKDMTLDMYSTYLPEKVKRVYFYDDSYKAYRVGYEATNYQEVKDVVLFTEALLEQLEGDEIKSDVEKGTAGKGYIEIPGSCVTKYKWRKVEKITYTELEECKEVSKSAPVPDGYTKISGVKICRSVCKCINVRSRSTVAWHAYDGGVCDCYNAKRPDGKTVAGICRETMSSKSGGNREANLKACAQDAWSEYQDYLDRCDDIYKDDHYKCTYNFFGKTCYWSPSYYESWWNSCKNRAWDSYSDDYDVCVSKYGIAQETELRPGATECYDNSPIDWGASVSKYSPRDECNPGYETVYGLCKRVTKSYNQYSYYNGISWISGDSSYAKWTMEDLSGQSGVEKMVEKEFCSYYKPSDLEQTDQITGLVTYELPLAYVEKGTGYIYNNDNKSSATNPFINPTGDRKIYTDLKSSDIPNYPLRIVGRNIGFNRYTYDLPCNFNLLSNGLFEPDPGQQGLIVYRPIDPKDPFPRYAPLANWQGKEYLITKLGYGVYTITPEYEIGLDSVSINAIRGYNASNACQAGQKINCGYLDYNINEKGESSFIHKMFSNLFKVNKK